MAFEITKSIVSDGNGRRNRGRVPLPRIFSFSTFPFHFLLAYLLPPSRRTPSTLIIILCTKVVNGKYKKIYVCTYARACVRICAYMLSVSTLYDIYACIYIHIYTRASVHLYFAFISSIF